MVLPEIPGIIEVAMAIIPCHRRFPCHIGFYCDSVRTA